MDKLEELIEKAKGRDKLSVLNDDTAIEEELAALYLCVSPKKLGELRANGGGPKFIKPTDPKAAGRNQPVAYQMGELRKWRLSMTAGSNLEIAKLQGMVGWVSALEPFWTDSSGRLIGSAIDRLAGEWADFFLCSLVGTVKVAWLNPADAAKTIWASHSAHAAFILDYKNILENEIHATFAALQATEMAMEIPEPEPRKPNGPKSER